MTTTTFNAVTYVKKLKDSGMSQSTAEVIGEETSNIFNNDIVTKEFMALEVKTLRDEMKMLEMRLQGFIVKSLISTVSVLGILQGIFHFMK